MPTVLVIDDEPAILEIVQRFLERDGFNVLTANDGLTGVRFNREAQPDLVILDVMLPLLNGWQVLETIREESAVPVIMLTAKGAETERLRGLTSGVDDYLVKPFSPLELVARVRLILRRVSPVLERLQVGDLEFDLSNHSVFLAGAACDLTPLEFKLLLLVARHPGRLFSREELLERVWGLEYPGVIRVVDVHISSLRRKLGERGELARHLVQTVHGRGYRFEQPA